MCRTQEQQQSKMQESEVLTLYGTDGTMFTPSNCSAFKFDLDEIQAIASQDEPVASPAKRVKTSHHGPEELFRVRVDVRQFTPEEVHVDHNADYLFVTGKHLEQGIKQQFVSHEFKRTYEIPEDVDPDQLRCSWHINNVMVIKAARNSRKMSVSESSDAGSLSPSASTSSASNSSSSTGSDEASPDPFWSSFSNETSFDFLDLFNIE